MRNPNLLSRPEIVLPIALFGSVVLGYIATVNNMSCLVTPINSLAGLISTFSVLSRNK